MKYQSIVKYSKGTILFDDVTGEVFEVVACSRISIFNNIPMWGITLKELKNECKF